MSGEVIPLRVAVRVRPLVQKEIDEGCQTCLNYIPYEPQLILGKDRCFTYDCVFRPSDPQITVYEEAVKPLIEHIFKGYNATVLAYGQTGSGKTFTMGGGYEASLKMDPEGMGIIPRIIKEIFSGIEERLDYDFKVTVSYLEIINEELQDLLVSNKKEMLNIREENGQIRVPGLLDVVVHDTTETMRCLKHGCDNRTTAATAMNNTSSRSHAIFSLNIEQKNKLDSNDYWKVKLQLVDLAGSERIKKTHAEGERLKEGININKGLLSLGNVISVLGDDTQKKDKKVHVPYRDSKLTRILQDSLGGNSHTLMIACVSPADSNMEETLNTLRYADRAKKIKNKPVVNWDAQTAEIMRLKAQVQQLTMKLIEVGLTDLSDSDVQNAAKCLSPQKNRAHSDILKQWTDKCQSLEEEVESLSRELQHSVDQAACLGEKAIKWEMKSERLKNRLKELETNIGVDLDLLSSNLTEEANPMLVEQIGKIKSWASKLQDSVSTIDAEENIVEDEEEEIEGFASPSIPATPETREMAKQHTLRRAKLNSELLELNDILEKKERLASQMTHNDVKIVAMKEQYEANMKQLEVEISSLQKEKETLSSALEGVKVNTAASKVSEQRRIRLQELENQMTELKKKLTEQKRLLKLKDESDKHVAKLNSEIQILKQTRVKLMKQMKEDAEQWRKWRQQKDKEVLQLQQKDRKRQFEIQKLQRENLRTRGVLQRKSEEAAAANRRLKEALFKKKKVMEEKSQQFEKCDNTAIGNRVKKLLSHELDVKVGVMEAKYYRESQLEDRKLLAEQLKLLKESLDDDGPPSKKMAWMDKSDQKHETSFHEENINEKINELQQQIELRNVQIADLQQKIFDAEQDSRGKTFRDNLHTMMEAKVAIKWLLEQAVSYKADNNRLRLEMDDLKDGVNVNDADNEKYIIELEQKFEDLKKRHQATVMKMQREHQKEIGIILASTPSALTTDADLMKRLEVQKTEIGQLNKLNKQLCKKTQECGMMEKHLTKYMYQDKSVALLPELPEDENQPLESPFLTPRPKPRFAAVKSFKPRSEMSESDNTDIEKSDSECEDRENDPDWVYTPLFNKIRSKKRRTEVFDQPRKNDKRLTDNKGCSCTTGCRTKKCSCQKYDQFCSEMCKCSLCSNLEMQLPQSTTTELQDSASRSLLNTTFEVEPSISYTDKNSSKSSEPESVITKPPAKLTKQTNSKKHLALKPMQTEDVRISSESQKLFKTSTSSGNLKKILSKSNLHVTNQLSNIESLSMDTSGNLRKKSSKSNLRAANLSSSSESLSMDTGNTNSSLPDSGVTSQPSIVADASAYLEGGVNKTCKLFNPRESFFAPLDM